MPATTVSLRVMTWNVKALGRPWMTSRRAMAAAVAVLRAAAPDVVGLQERPRGPLARRQLRVLARRAGLRAVVGGGASRTTGLLVRPGLRVQQARGVRLPWRPPRTLRGASTAVVEGLRVVVVHLGLHAEERAGHVRLLLGSLDEHPVVLVGDLNEVPGSPSWHALEAAGLADAAADVGPTFPAAAPLHRIDVVLVGYGLRVTGAHVLDDPGVLVASDHLAVVADVSRAGASASDEVAVRARGGR